MSEENTSTITEKTVSEMPVQDVAAVRVDPFEEFKKLVAAENPDIARLSDILNNHPEWFSDNDKKRLFSHLVLPQIAGDSVAEKLKALTATATALNELGQDPNSNITAEHFESFMGLKARDKWAVSDFLEKGITGIEQGLADENSQLNEATKAALAKKRDILYNTLGDLQSARERFGQRQGFSNDDNSLLVGGGLMAENEQENTGNLNINATENQPPHLSVNSVSAATPANGPDERKNIANITDAGNDKQRKNRKPYEPQKVREQDLMDFMFNEWFLGSFNWLLKKCFGSKNGYVASDVKPQQLSSFSAPQQAQSVNNNTTARNTASAPTAGSNTLNAYAQGSDAATIDNGRLMQHLLVEYPQTLNRLFEAKMAKITKSMTPEEKSQFVKFTKSVSKISVLQYMCKRKDAKTPLDMGILNKIALDNANTFFGANKQLQQNKTLSEEAKTTIFQKFVKTADECADGLLGDLRQYHDSKETDKDKAWEKVEKSEQKLKEQFAPENIMSSYQMEKQTEKKGPIDMKTAGQQEFAQERKSEAFTTDIKAWQAHLDEAQKNNAARKSLIANWKNKQFGNTQSLENLRFVRPTNQAVRG